MVDRNKIFTVENTINNKKYIFIGGFSEIDLIVNNFNNNGLSELSNSEKTVLEKYINIKKITKTTVLVKALLNLNDTIDRIKKKILIYCDGTLPKHQHLWIKRKNLTDYEKMIFKKQSNLTTLCKNKTVDCKETIQSYNDILGLEYSLDKTKQIIQCDLSDPLEIEDSLYTFTDKTHFLLQHYNTISTNTIYLTDFNDLLQAGVENMDYIEPMYFPFIKKDPTTSENYTGIIKDLVKQENKMLEVEPIKENNEILYSNIVFTGKQENIDVYKLFHEIVLDEEVSFCKYKSKTKTELYKLYKGENNPQIITEDFRNPDKYIVEFKDDLYSYPIERNHLIEWTQTILSKTEMVQKGLEIEPTNNEYLLLKLKFQKNYLDLQIFKDKITIRYLKKELLGKDNVSKELSYKQIIKLLKFSNDKIATFVPHITLTLDDLVTADFQENIREKKLSYLKLNSNISKYPNFVYKYVPDAQENNFVYINYKRVDTFTSFENIRRYFLKIKQDNKLSVSNFNKTWINETNKLFNLSEPDSLQMLSVIKETLDSEELKKTPMDIAVKMTIEFGYFDGTKDGAFQIKAENCGSFLIINQVREFMNFVFKDSIKSKIETIKEDKFVFQIKESKITEDDEFDMGDLVDLEIERSNSENLENNNNNNNNIIANNGPNELDQTVENVDNSNTDFEQVQLQKMTISAYMSTLRKRDNKLYNFESNLHAKYTRGCGAAAMRQPILLTKNELTNFEKINPAGYKILKQLEWGSSAVNKHFVICPRIWCIRDKIALTDDQFIQYNKTPDLSGNYIEDKNHLGGRCPFCHGEVIEEDADIGNNNTVIIRIGGGNKYWEDIPKQAEKTKEWLKYLEGTEKEGFPGLLNPKLHPKGLCMPCCFKKDSGRTLSKCATTNIDYTTDSKLEPESLVIGGSFEETIKLKDKQGKTNKIILKENDTVLLKHTKKNIKNQVYIITKEGPLVYDKLTKLELFLKRGFVIKIVKGLHKGVIYNTTLNKELFVFKENVDELIMMEDKYIRAEKEHDALGEGKNGVLFKRLNKLLNGTETLINESRLMDGTDQFIRVGVNQTNLNTSFLSAMAAFKTDITSSNITYKPKKSWSAEKLIRAIIENCNPIEFMGLNNGDLLKLFSAEETILNIETSVLHKWCKAYPDFLSFFINRPEKIGIKEQLKIVENKNQTKQLMKIVHAFENFKKYCGDMNIPKDPIIFTDILSQKQKWFSTEAGLNIIIFEKIIKDKRPMLYTHCPIYEDTFDDSNKICLLVKNNQSYEPIFIAKTIKGVYLPQFIGPFNQTSVNYTNTKLINAVNRLYYFTKNNCDWKFEDSLYKTIYENLQKLNYEKLKSLQTIEKSNTIKFYITDEYLKGIGVMLENELIIFTRPYRVEKEAVISNRKISELPLLSYTKLLKLLGKDATSIILKDNIIFAIGLKNGSFHPVERIEYKDSIHKLEIVEFNYEFELDSSNSNNNSSRFISSHKSDEEHYTNLKNELKSFFSNTNKNMTILRTHLETLLSSTDITKKRKELFRIIKEIITKLTSRPSSNRTKKNNIKCNTKNTKKCKKSNSCEKTKGTLTLGSKQVAFNFRTCDLDLATVIKKRSIYRITEEILFSFSDREEILFGKYLFEETDEKNVLVEGENYLDYIESIFDVKNMYLSQNTTLNMWPITLGKSKLIDLEGYSVKNPTTNIEQIKEDFTEKEIQLAKNQNDIFEEKTGKSKNKHGLEINDSKIQEGVCIFPFRVKKNTNLETQCIFHDNKDNGLICATEVDDNRVMTKYGFCTDGKCSSNMFGTEKDMMGKSQKTLNGIPNKPGYCCFPFKGTKKEGHTEYTECKETDYGPICATSVYESDEIALDKTKSVVKGQIKTFGFCPITKNTTKTKSGKECIFPFISKVEGTKKLYNKCIIKPNHESDPAYSVKNLFVCPIKTNTKLGDIKGVDFDACEDHDSGEIDYSKWEYKKGLLIRKRGLSLTDLKKTKRAEHKPGKFEEKKVYKINVPPILPLPDKKKLSTVKAAMDHCETLPKCKGVTEGPKYKITLRSSSRLDSKFDDHKSWIRKETKHK